MTALIPNTTYETISFEIKLPGLGSGITTTIRDYLKQLHNAHVYTKEDKDVDTSQIPAYGFKLTTEFVMEYRLVGDTNFDYNPTILRKGKTEQGNTIIVCKALGLPRDLLVCDCALLAKDVNAQTKGVTHVSMYSTGLADIIADSLMESGVSLDDAKIMLHLHCEVRYEAVYKMHILNFTVEW